MTKNEIEIKDSKERKEIAAVLFENGYTVRKVVKNKPGAKTKITVLEYWKGEEI